MTRILYKFGQKAISSDPVGKKVVVQKQTRSLSMAAASQVIAFRYKLASPGFLTTHLKEKIMEQDYTFGPHLIRRTEVFAETPLSFAFVNLKPVVPGRWLRAVIMTPLYAQSLMRLLDTFLSTLQPGMCRPCFD